MNALDDMIAKRDYLVRQIEGLKAPFDETVIDRMNRLQLEDVGIPEPALRHEIRTEIWRLESEIAELNEAIAEEQGTPELRVIFAPLGWDTAYPAYKAKYPGVTHRTKVVTLRGTEGVYRSYRYIVPDTGEEREAVVERFGEMSNGPFARNVWVAYAPEIDTIFHADSNLFANFDNITKPTE